MKKTVIVSLATLFMISCGGSSSQVSCDSCATDSTAVVDSSVVALDSSVSKIDSVKLDGTFKINGVFVK